jgi:hypothetical protein
MNTIFHVVILTYVMVSGSITLAGIALIAKHYFFPKPTRDQRPTLMPLGPNGTHLSSSGGFNYRDFGDF